MIKKIERYTRQNVLKAVAFGLVVLLFSPVCPANAQTEPDITTGLVGHWKLDEISGTTIEDSSGNGYDGTLDTVTLPAASVNGLVGSAIDFNDAGHVSVAANATFPTITQTTIAAWVKPHDVENASLDGIFGVEGMYDVFVRNNSNEIQFNADAWNSSGGAWQTDNIDPINANVWVHYAVTYDASNTANDPVVYVNGQVVPISQQVEPDGAFVPPATADITIGERNGASSSDFNGIIDDLRYYNRVLTPEDVAYLYESFDGNVRYDEDVRTPKYFNGDDWVAMGPSKYTPNAVAFNGTNDYLSYGSPLAGVSDGKTITASFWAKFNSYPSSGCFTVYNTNPSRVRIVYCGNGTETMQLELRDTGGALRANIGCGPDPHVVDTWYHHLISVNMTTGEAHCYVDDADSLQTFSAPTDVTLDFTNAQHTVGAGAGPSELLEGDIADLWIDYETYIDFSIEANRRKFIDADGDPIYLGASGSAPTGSAPDIFLSGDTDAWHTNKGTGGGFTENGALTDTSLSPGQIFINPYVADSGNAWIQDASLLNGGQAVVIDGQYAYFAAYMSDRLTVLDISDPLNPVVADGGAATYASNLIDGIIDIAKQGDYLYAVSLLNDRFTVFDVSDPLNPTIEAQILDSTRMNGPRGVTVNGNYAYVASQLSNSITVIDISNPTAPVVADSGSAWLQDGTRLNGAIKIGIQGNYAYVASYNGDSLTTVDISDPLNPYIPNGGNAWVQDASLLDLAFDVVVRGDYAYVTAGTADRFTVVDISDPLNPLIANGGSASIADSTKMNRPGPLEMYGDYAFVGSNDGDSLTMIDISDPLNPVIANGGQAWLQDSTRLNDVRGLAISPDGKYAYVSTFAGDSLTVVDVDARGSCTSPTRDEGSVIYNENSQVMQYCDGEEWQAMGPVPGDGTGGCSNPIRAEGSMVFNKDYGVMQYCEGDEWIVVNGAALPSGGGCAVHDFTLSPDSVMWTTLAASANMNYIAAIDLAVDGPLKISSDGGASWTDRGPSHDWYSIDTSANGSRMIATVGRFGDAPGVYLSTDYGVNWALQDTAVGGIVAMSDDGMTAISTGSTFSNYLLTSTDGGVNWTQSGTDTGWGNVEVSGDGSLMVAVRSNQIFTSTNGGTSWVGRISGENFGDITSSYDGSRLAAVVPEGQIYVSDDSGVTWTARDAARTWNNIVSNDDGMILGATVEYTSLSPWEAGYIFISIDGGVSWTRQDDEFEWYGIDVTADGSRFVAGEATDGGVYLSECRE